MRRLILADLRASIALWIPALTALTVAAAIGAGVAIAMWTGILVAPDARILEGVEAIGTTVGVITVASAAGIIGSACALCLSSQAREHALWLLTGMRPHQLRRVLRGQILALALLAGILAVPLSYLSARAVLWQWAQLGLVPNGQGPILAGGQIPLTLGLTVLMAVWGAAGPTRRATTVPKMAALRASAGGRARAGWVKILVAIVALGGAIAILMTVLSGAVSAPEERVSAVMSACLLLILALLLVPAWTLRPLLHAWTALVPSRAVAWRLARANCRFSSARSLTMITPFAVATSLVAVLDGGISAVAGAEGYLAELAVVLGPPLAVTWCGVCVIAMVRRDRERDDSLLAVAGGGPGLRRATAALEGLVYALTAVLFGAIFLIGSGLLMSSAAGMPVSTAMGNLPWSHQVVLALATVATSVGAVLWTGRAEPRLAAAG